MSTRIFTEAFGAGETREVGAGGRLLYIIAASSAINVETTGTPNAPATLQGVGAGLKYRRPDRWRTLKFTSPGAQNITFAVSDDDDIEIANAVTVSGVAAVLVSPATVFTAGGLTTLATANSLDIAANLARRRITISSDPTSAGTAWIRDQTGITDGGIPLQPGTFVELQTTAAIRVRNNTGGDCFIGIAEES